MHIHHRENPPWMETQVDFILLWICGGNLTCTPESTCLSAEVDFGAQAGVDFWWIVDGFWWNGTKETYKIRSKSTPKSTRAPNVRDAQKPTHPIHLKSTGELPPNWIFSVPT